MGSLIRRLRIKSLKAEIEASHLHCASLANEIKVAETGIEKAQIANRYDHALIQNHALRLLLEWLERKEREQSKTQE